MAELYYQGHGSFRVDTADGRTVYVDPYAGDGYDAAADLILVTHAHGDHDQVQLIGTRKPGCVLFTHEQAIAAQGYRALDLGWITVEPVKAQNKNHDPACCVGYVLTVDGKKIWAAGDTSRYEEMKELKSLCLDWALLPTDGIYNMGPEEAARCAEDCGCRQAVPIHCAPGKLYDPAVAERFDFAGRVLVGPGQRITL